MDAVGPEVLALRASLTFLACASDYLQKDFFNSIDPKRHS
jgi:hypothetical protein